VHTNLIKVRADVWGWFNDSDDWADQQLGINSVVRGATDPPWGGCEEAALAVITGTAGVLTDEGCSLLG
jgi:hypothetical protein